MALDFVAGCFGGIAGIFAGHPFDTIKVNLQTQDAQKPKYRGAVDCIRQIFAKESVRGLYKGVLSPVSGVALTNSIIFGVYGNALRLQADSESLKAHFVAGAWGGFANSFVCSPMELVKTRMQLQDQVKEKYKGNFDCFMKIWQRGGVRGIFQGLGITALREIPGYAGYFVIYETMVNKDSDSFRIFMAGGLAGAISWATTYPIDVVKTRLQMDIKQQYTGIFDCTKKLYMNEGLSVFSRGLSIALVRAFQTSGACLVVVTAIHRLTAEVKEKPVLRLKLDDDKSRSPTLFNTVEAAESSQLTKIVDFENDRKVLNVFVEVPK